MNLELLAKAKSLGFSDRQIAHLTGRTEDDNIWILGTSSDTRPSIDYLYDRGARSYDAHQRGFTFLSPLPGANC